MDRESMNVFQTGVYRHWQGNLFRALALIEHPETHELLVACERDHDGKKLLRPYATPGVSSWTDPLPGGKKRFEFVSGIAMLSPTLRPCEMCPSGESQCPKPSACVLSFLREYGAL